MNLPDLAVALAGAYWLKGYAARSKIRTVLNANPQVRDAIVAAGFDLNAESYLVPAVVLAYFSRKLAR